jgi:hypothetical protein
MKFGGPQEFTKFTLNNAHTVDFAMKRCVFSRHGLQGFV